MSVSINGTGSISGIDQGFNVTSGSVGIGTDNPSHELDIESVSPTIELKDSDNDYKFQLTQSGSATYIDFDTDGSGSSSLRIRNAYDEKIRIQSDGKVGIGTNNPTKLLELFGTDPTIKLMDSSGDAYALIEGDSADQGSIRFRADPLGAGSGTHIRFDTDGTERLRIDSSGRVLLNGGTTARENMLNSTFTSQFQVDGTGHTTSSMSLVRNSNNSGSPYLTLGKSRSTSVNGAGLVSSGDGLGVISFQGGDGTHLQEGAAVLAQVDGTAATDNMPGRLLFLTNSGSTSSTERLRITSGGQVNIGGDFTQTGFTASITRNSSETDTLRIKGNGGNAFIRFEDNDASSSFTLGADDAVGSGGFALYDRSDSAYRVVVDTNGRVSINATSVVQIGGQTPYLYVSSYTNLDGLRIRGLDTGNTIWKDGGDMSLTVASNHAINLKTQSATRLSVTGGGDIGINETSPDTTLHISKSAAQSDTHGILKVESTSTGTGAQTNASLIVKNRYGWAQFMQWEENGLRVGSRSTSTGGTGTVTVTYGSDNTGAVINENGVVTMPQQCGFHVVMHSTQTPNSNEMVYLWDTDASDSRSYIKNCTFNAGRFVAPVAGLYYFTAQLLLMNVSSSDDNIHLSWTKGSSNNTFSYWNTRTDGQSANGYMGYGGYLPVTGSTTVYLTANEIFGIRIQYSGDIDVYGTDANWGHWSGFLVG